MLLRAIDYKDLTNDDITKFLSILIRHIYSYKKSEMISILHNFIENEINLSEIPYYIRLLRSQIISDDEIKYYIDNLNSLLPYVILSDIISTKENSEDNVFAFDRIIKIYGPPDYETYVFLRLKCDENIMMKLYDFITDLMPDVSDDQEKPEYMVEIDNLEKLRSDALERFTIHIDNEEESEKRKIENINNDELTSLFGPPHGFIPKSINSDDSVCCKLGSCRMFECNHISIEDEEDLIIDDEKDWFTGYCSVCSKHILSKERSLRMPGISGGWVGCYCSKECMMKYIDGGDTLASIFKDADDDEIFAPIIISIIKSIYKKLSEVKVYEQLK